MEIGSFLELELRETGEYYNEGKDVAGLNTGRSGILHSLRILRIEKIHLPIYLCPTVKDFLNNNGIIVIPYHISECFEPMLSSNDITSSVLIVNYFGIISHNKILEVILEGKAVG